MNKSERAFKIFFREVLDATKFLVEKGFADDQNPPIRVLETKKHPRDPERISISFPKANYASMLKKVPYTEIYEGQLSTRSFNARMLDGALLQMSYTFANGALERHRLVFLPSPDLLEFQNEPEIYLEEVMYAEVVEKQVVTVPLRFDYDNRPETPNENVHHPVAHLTLGQYSNCRIAASSPVSPSLFVEFIVRGFYNTAARQLDTSLPIPKQHLTKSITKDEESLIHVGIPSSARSRIDIAWPR